MSMRKTIVFGLIGVCAAVAAMSLRPSGAPEAPLAAVPPHPSSPHAIPAQAAVVQSAVSTQLVVDTRGDRTALRAAGESEPGVDDAPEPVPASNRIERLVAAGFTRARAAEILELEAELRRAAYVAEYEASGTVRPLDSGAHDRIADRLRAQLGDLDYERYLEATGQPRSVVVRGVDASSAAAHAGLMPGDEILAYAGQRVFNQRDLNGLMLAGTPGEVVPATVVRDGQTLQLYVTRGPLGLM